MAEPYTLAVGQHVVQPPHRVVLVPLRPWDLPFAEAGLCRVYAGAFGRPPYLEGPADVERFRARLALHTCRTGFRCLAAVDRGGPKRVVGFAYGFTSHTGAPPQPWYRDIEAAVGDEQVLRWLRGQFEFTEFAVAPRAQGCGIGGRLHDALLAELPHSAAWLVTRPDAPAAHRLYQRRGWIELGRYEAAWGGLRLVLGRTIRPYPATLTGPRTSGHVG